MDILELKNSTTKIKNLVDVFSSKMEGDRRKNPRSCPIWTTEREKKSDKNPRDPGDYIKRANIHVIGI